MLRPAVRAIPGAIAAIAIASTMACVPRHRVEHLTLEPVVIHVAADGTASAESPDPELDLLVEMQEKGACEAALPGFERFLEDFPESARWIEAVYRTGVCEEQLDRLDRARGYYLFVAKHARGEPAAQGALRAAYVLESLGRPEQAAGEYAAIAGMRGASGEARVGARLRRVLCLFRATKRKSARRELVDAIGRYESLPTPSDSIRASAAEARFAAAESLAAELIAVKLEYPQSRLEKRVAEKIRRLTVATDAYTDVVAIKDAEWAAASVFRIGELCEGFYRDLVTLPPPPRLTPGQQAAYAAQVEIKARPLKQKAFDAYLRVSALGERVGLESPWIEKARARVKELEPQLKNEVLSADPHGGTDE